MFSPIIRLSLFYIYVTELVTCGFRHHVLASAKHFVGDGGTTKGINENNTVANRNELMSIHMPAYYDAVYQGVGTVMISYSSWNGVKMHANRDLITGFLKNTLHFKVNSIPQKLIDAFRQKLNRVINYESLFRDLSSQTGKESTESRLPLMLIIRTRS